jgi:hypothetical protein
MKATLHEDGRIETEGEAKEVIELVRSVKLMKGSYKAKPKAYTRKPYKKRGRRGLTHSEETKAKISRAVKKKHRERKAKAKKASAGWSDEDLGKVRNLAKQPEVKAVQVRKLAKQIGRSQGAVIQQLWMIKKGKR